MEKSTLYLITGAAGHLGTALITALREKGCKVRALCRAGGDTLPEDVDVYYGDVCDQASMEEFFSNTGDAELIVIHCAGIVSIAAKFDPKVYAVNVEGTKNVVELCISHAVRKLIYVSSVHAIPEKPKGQVMTEDCAFSPDAVVGLYAETKAEATAYVLAAAKRGLDAEVVFPSGIIGPYDRGHSHTNQVVEDYLNGKLTAAVRGGYDFSDVRDVAEGIIACAEKGRSGRSYILSGGYHSIREILTILHEETGKKPVTVYLPVGFIRAMAPLCELYYKLRKKPPLFTGYSMYTLMSNSAFSNARAREELGYSPRSIRETLKDTVDWLRRSGRLSAQKNGG